MVIFGYLLEFYLFGNNVLVFLVDFVVEMVNGVVFVVGLEFEDMEGLGNDYFFFFVIGRGNIFEDFEVFKGSGIVGGFVGNYVMDGFVEDVGGSVEVEGV